MDLNHRPHPYPKGEGGRGADEQGWPLSDTLLQVERRMPTSMECHHFAICTLD
jgi:hypothetical protein